MQFMLDPAIQIDIMMPKVSIFNIDKITAGLC